MVTALTWLNPTADTVGFATARTNNPALQACVNLLSGLTSLHLHSVSPPVAVDDLNGLFTGLPALQVFAARLQRHSLSVGMG